MTNEGSLRGVDPTWPDAARELIAELRAQLAEHERIATSDLRLAWASDEARTLREQLRDVDTKRSRLLADCRDLERENASLRRRLAVGGR